MIIARTRLWFFVYDVDGDVLAAFPERSLAGRYSEGTEWEIREQLITF
jgi:hypothetical protein